MKTYSTIDEFIAQFPSDVQAILQELRRVIHETAPGATEAISYGIPTFKLQGNLVHFSAYKSHIGFYPTSSGIEKFKDQLSEYNLSRGTVRFPIEKPLPYDLIRKIVSFRVAENKARAAAKAGKQAPIE